MKIFIMVFFKVKIHTKKEENFLTLCIYQIKYFFLWYIHKLWESRDEAWLDKHVGFVAVSSGSLRESEGKQGKEGQAQHTLKLLTEQSNGRWSQRWRSNEASLKQKCVYPLKSCERSMADKLSPEAVRLRP